MTGNARTYANNIVLNSAAECERIIARRDTSNGFYQYYRGRQTAAEDILRAIRQDEERAAPSPPQPEKKKARK